MSAMKGRISDEAIRQVRERASISEVVSDVVALRRRGRSAVGLCPFHTEKTPSFNVSEERGFFHCFGCGEHGDVFGFVMKTRSLAFPEAVREIAQRFGVTLPEPVEGALVRANRSPRRTRSWRPSFAPSCGAPLVPAPAHTSASAASTTR